MSCLAVASALSSRRGRYEAAVEENMPISCDARLSETILPEKDWSHVSEGSIEDDVAERCQF